MELHGKKPTMQLGRAIVLPDGIVTEEKLSDDVKTQIAAKEDKSNKSNTIWNNDGDNAYPTTNAIVNDVYSIFQEKQDLSEKATSIDNPNHTQYPTTKAVADALASYEKWDNKVDTIDEEAPTEIQGSAYPNMGATVNFVNNKIGWELIGSGTLTEDVQMFSPYIGNSYKKLYLLIRVPTINPDKVSSFSKARIRLFDQNNDMIYDDGSINYYPDIGQSWAVTFEIEIVGDRAIILRKFMQNMSGNYSVYIVPEQYNWIQQTLGAKVNDGYINGLNVVALPDTTRYFPTGTVYEVWGVKA